MALIGGGIGITSCLSVWKHLLQGVSKPEKVVMVGDERRGGGEEDGCHVQRGFLLLIHKVDRFISHLRIVCYEQI